MNTKHHFIVLFLTFVTLSATAAERQYQSIDQFLNTLSPAPVWEVVEGDLNGDGLSDRAIVTHKPNSAVTPKIYILLQTLKGSFYLAQESKTGTYHNGSVELTIENGSLYVHLEAIKSTEQGTHQFKLYRGAWRLIGLTHLIKSMHNDPDGAPNFFATDINLLTGDIIVKNVNSGEVTERGKTTGGQCLLADYDFDFLFCVIKWKTQKGLPISALN